MVFLIAVTFSNVFFSFVVNLNSVVFLIAVTLSNIVVFLIAVTFSNQFL